MIFVVFDNNRNIEAVYNDNKPVVVTDYECRHDWKSFEQVKEIAKKVSEFTGETYVGTDAGSYVSPRYDVQRVPHVGDKVSYTFNGDYYPDGTVTKVSKTLKRVFTSEGHVYLRVRKTGTWRRNGTWSLIQGHINERNPSF